MQPPTVGCHRALQPIQPPLTVRVVADDGAAFVASRHHVVKSTRQFDSQRSCHSPRIPPFPSPVNHKRLTSA